MAWVRHRPQGELSIDPPEQTTNEFGGNVADETRNFGLARWRATETQAADTASASAWIAPTGEEGPVTVIPGHRLLRRL